MPEDLAERARRLIERGIGADDDSVLLEVVDPDVVEHQRGNHSGLAGVREVVATLHRWMSDFSLTVDALVVDGDCGWARSTARGVNTASIMGTPPSRESVTVCVFDVLRFVDGRLVEHWGVADQLGLLLQVGALPRRPRPPTPSGAA